MTARPDSTDPHTAGPHTVRPPRRAGRSTSSRVGAVAVLALVLVGAACTDDAEDGPGDDVRPSESTASTTPQAGREGDDPAESRDNVDEDRDDSGAGSPFDENSDEGSNSGARGDADAGVNSGGGGSEGGVGAG